MAPLDVDAEGMRAAKALSPAAALRSCQLTEEIKDGGTSRSAPSVQKAVKRAFAGPASDNPPTTGTSASVAWMGAKKLGSQEPHAYPTSALEQSGECGTGSQRSNLMNDTDAVTLSTPTREKGEQLAASTARKNSWVQRKTSRQRYATSKPHKERPQWSNQAIGADAWTQTQVPPAIHANGDYEGQPTGCFKVAYDGSEKSDCSDSKSPRATEKGDGRTHFDAAETPLSLMASGKNVLITCIDHDLKPQLMEALDKYFKSGGRNFFLLNRTFAGLEQYGGHAAHEFVDQMLAPSGFKTTNLDILPSQEIVVIDEMRMMDLHALQEIDDLLSKTAPLHLHNHLGKPFGGRQIIALDTPTFPLDTGPFAACPECGATTTKVSNDDARIYGFICSADGCVMWDHRRATSSSELWQVCEFEIVSGRKLFKELKEAEERGELMEWW